jgi:type I site-specific restriction endonuclease
MEEVASVAFEKFQSEMAIHQSASRAILTNICQRLANLEVTVSNLQKDMVESKKNTDVTEDLNEVKKNVSTISNLIETFQTEMQHQKDNIILVSTSVNEAHLRVDDVNKVGRA